MVIDLVKAQVDDIPAPPSSLYLRPTLIGTLPNIGAAASPSTEALLYVLASPVGDYFAGGARPLKLLVEDQRSRSTEQLGSTKTGGNYAGALGPTLDAKETYGADTRAPSKLISAASMSLSVVHSRLSASAASLAAWPALRPFVYPRPPQQVAATLG